MAQIPIAFGRQQQVGPGGYSYREGAQGMWYAPQPGPEKTGIMRREGQFLVPQMGTPLGYQSPTGGAMTYATRPIDYAQNELERRPGETYEDYIKRLKLAGYTVPSYDTTPQEPKLMKFTTPTAPTMAQPTPIAPTPQPTPTPSISFAPAAQQPTYQPAPAQKYQSTYYQANGYKPYGGYQQDTFGDKPFGYAYKQPRLMQSYTGI